MVNKGASSVAVNPPKRFASFPSLNLPNIETIVGGFQLLLKNVFWVCAKVQLCIYHCGKSTAYASTHSNTYLTALSLSLSNLASTAYYAVAYVMSDKFVRNPPFLVVGSTCPQKWVTIALAICTNVPVHLRLYSIRERERERARKKHKHSCLLLNSE